MTGSSQAPPKKGFHVARAILVKLHSRHKINMSIQGEGVAAMFAVQQTDAFSTGWGAHRLSRCNRILAIQSGSL